MALFKIHKGTEKNNDGTSKLPQSYVEGYAYFATDTGRFYIDTTDEASGRKMINPDAITNITRSGTTFTATKVDGSTITFTQQDNNTTYSAGTGISLSGTTFSLDVAGTKTALGLGSNAYTSTAYLPLSGGKLKSSTDVPLEISSSTTSGSYIRFTNSEGTILGWIGYTGQDNPVISGGSNDVNYTILHAGNYSNYALPISGGSMQGSIWFNGDFSYPGVWFRDATNSKNVGGIYMNPSSGNNQLNIRWARDDGGGDGYYYINGRPSDGAVVATKFVGSGEELTSLNASNITSGTIAEARLPKAYLPLAGGTMTGTLNAKEVTFSSSSYFVVSGYTKGTAPSSTIYRELLTKDSAGTATANNISIFGSSVDTSGYHHAFIRCYAPISGSTAAASFEMIAYTDGTYKATCSAPLYGAVWNDYAEYRSQIEEIKPGYIAYSEDDGKLRLTSERLQAFEGVVSDTFGFAIGETDDCKTPLAVSGRALVYCNPDDDFHSGDCVCAGPGGLAYRMTREEIIEFPDRIVGVVSEIPTYETWGSGNVEVNGRIWVKVR